MKTYTVDYVKEPISKDVWKKIESVSLHSPWKKYFNGYKTKAKLFHTDEAIYVFMKTTETEILSKRIRRNSLVCLESCMEFFFSPSEMDKRYFNFEISTKGTMFSGLCKSQKDLIKLYDDINIFDIKTVILNEGWELYFKVPFSFIKKYFNQVSPVIRGNFYKCAEKTKHPHFDIWNDIKSNTPDFHSPQFFGELRLAGWDKII